MNRINLVCLGVRDMKRSLAFYPGIGFTTSVTDDEPPIVFFNNQGSKLELFPLDELARDIDAENPPVLSAGGGCGITLACNTRSREEVDAFMARVQQYGGNIAKTPQDVFWGGYSGYFQDPDGYYWEVAYAEIWEFDQNEMLIIR